VQGALLVHVIASFLRAVPNIVDNFVFYLLVLCRWTYLCTTFNTGFLTLRVFLLGYFYNSSWQSANSPAAVCSSCSVALSVTQLITFKMLCRVVFITPEIFPSCLLPSLTGHNNKRLFRSTRARKASSNTDVASGEGRRVTQPLRAAETKERQNKYFQLKEKGLLRSTNLNYSARYNGINVISLSCKSYCGRSL
jgi:hypothetical protein